MKDYGLVSVITASYNCSRFVEDAINSVLSQTYPNWEMIITDDGSSDDTVDVINRYVGMDPRIKLFCLKENSGAGVARNNSIEKSTGRYIAFLDADDKWIPERLEKQLFFMNVNDAAFGFCSFVICDQEWKMKRTVVAKDRLTLFQDICDNKVGFSTAIYDTQKLGKVYMPAMRKRQDWALGIKILQRCGIAYGLKEPLVYYRVGQASLSKNKLSLIKYHLKIYMEILGWSATKALLFFFVVNIPTNMTKKITAYFNRYNRT